MCAASRGFLPPRRSTGKGDCGMLGYRTLAALALMLIAVNAVAQDAPGSARTHVRADQLRLMSRYRPGRRESPQDRATVPHPSHPVPRRELGGSLRGGDRDRPPDDASVPPRCGADRRSPRLPQDAGALTVANASPAIGYRRRRRGTAVGASRKYRHPADLERGPWASWGPGVNLVRASGGDNFDVGEQREADDGRQELAQNRRALRCPCAASRRRWPCWPGSHWTQKDNFADCCFKIAFLVLGCPLVRFGCRCQVTDPCQAEEKFGAQKYDCVVAAHLCCIGCISSNSYNV